jgi:hypothetical protein
MAQHFGSVTVEEQTLGETRWVALRSRGADWSWLTPQDALLLARHWMAAYDNAAVLPAISERR